MTLDILKMTYLPIVFFGFIVACAPKRFYKDPEVDKCQNFTESCINENGLDYFNYSLTAPAGKVDVIFVNDNSGSMSPEQNSLASRFESFLGILDQRSVNYQIGVITTDVSSNLTPNADDDSSGSPLFNPPRDVNKNGSLQDGNLIPFPRGNEFLLNSDFKKTEDFATTIQRPETRRCEDFLRSYPNSPPPSKGMFDNCPSGDERGILSARLFLEKNSAKLRSDAALSFVFLADEDVRSGLYLRNDDFALDAKDKAQSFVDYARATFPGKEVSVHSIILKPGDTTCESSQNRQMGPASINPSFGITFNQIRGSQGLEYARASSLTNGIVGSICENDYGSILKDISTSIADRIQSFRIACRTPGDLKILIDGQISQNWTQDQDTLTLATPLAVGQKVDISYNCPRL
jgi:hypothetical protein